MPNYNLSQVLPLGILTGSRAFNCATETSDWDIVILKSNLPDYRLTPDYTSTDFTNDHWVLNPNNEQSKPGFDLSEHTEFDDDEGFIEYDQTIIWGPLLQIIKYWDDEDNCINLFVYEDHNGIILDKFIELNQLMNFIHNVRLQDRNYRIKAFTDIALRVGITNAS